MNTLQARCAKLWKEKGLTDEQIADGINMLHPEAIKHPDRYTDQQILDNAYYPCLWGGLGRALSTYIQWEKQNVS